MAHRERPIGRRDQLRPSHVPALPGDRAIDDLRHLRQERVRGGRREGAAHRRGRARRRAGAGVSHRVQGREVRLATELGVALAADRDEARAHLLEEGEDADELLGAAAVGEQQHDVAGDDAAEVAVHRLGRMQVHRRRAGG